MSKTHFENPYDAGYNAGMYGANNFNSHYSWFNSKERMKEWQRGNHLGSQKREAERESKKQKPMSDKKTAVAFLKGKGIIEEGYSKWVINFSDGRVFDIVELMEEYKNQAIEQTPSGYCRWVKASERLPEKQGKENSVIIECTFPGREFITRGFRNYDNETPALYMEVGSKSFLTVEGEGNFHSTVPIKFIRWQEESQLPLDARQIASDAWDAAIDFRENGFSFDRPDKEQYLSTLNTK